MTRDAETGQEQNASMQVLGTISEEELEALRKRQDDMPAPVDDSIDD